MAILEMENVNAYYGDSHVLYDLSLDIDQNEVVTLLGRNGAGKTTTLRSITGIVSRREGRITFRGNDITQKPVNKISRMGIKMVPEDRRIFPTLTAHENLLVAAEQCPNPRPIEEIYDIFPVVSEVRDNRGRNLSGGEQQMLAVGRALIQSPDLLLLDEPTEGLAPVIVEDIQEVLTEITQEDVTVLITEQNVQFALDLAERAYIIEGGANAWEGSVDELREREELMDNYLSVSVGETASD